MALNYHMLSFITKCVQEWALGGYYTVDYYIIFSTTYICVLAFLMVYMHTCITYVNTHNYNGREV